jgi:hypothetical protein
MRSISYSAMNPSTRILIVEDNPDDELLLLRQLKKAARHVGFIGHLLC